MASKRLTGKKKEQMTEEEKKKRVSNIFILLVIIGVFIAGCVDFYKGYGEKTRCRETATAEITDIRKHSTRGLVDKTVYYEFVVGETLYKCTDSFSFFVSYPKMPTETVHYNAMKPSESYLGNTPCDMKNGVKDFIVALVLTGAFVWLKKTNH